MKIGVYAICKNEEANVEEWLRSCADADSITVADTGSTDGTFELLCKSATVHQVRILPWRFDWARNSALALVPNDTDACFAIDLDERLPEDWRSLIEAKWVEGTTNAYFTNKFWNEEGTKSFPQNRIHSRHGHKWRYPCHEGLYFDGIEQSVRITELILSHYHDTSKDRSSYLGLLEMGLKEYPNDLRMIHYYARELLYRGRCAEAIPLFIRYLSMFGQVANDSPPRSWEYDETARLLALAGGG